MPTPTQTFLAEQVVVACGSYHRPRIPALAEQIPNVMHVHSCDYKNPAQLPEGDVLVVGTGQSGCCGFIAKIMKISN